MKAIRLAERQTSANPRDPDKMTQDIEVKAKIKNSQPQKTSVNRVGGSEKELPTRIRAVQARVGTVRKAAAIAGLSTDQLNRYMNGKSQPAFEPLAKLCSEAGVRLDWLWSGRGEMAQEEASIQRMDSARPFTRDWYDEGRQQELGSGLGEAAMRYMLKKEEVAEKTHLSVVTASGDAMEPTIKDGDTLMVDTSSRTPEGGHIYLVRVGEAELPKRLHRLLDGRIKITHDNRRYGDEIADADSLDIVGRVVWKGGYI